MILGDGSRQGRPPWTLGAPIDEQVENRRREVGASGGERRHSLGSQRRINLPHPTTLVGWQDEASEAPFG